MPYYTGRPRNDSLYDLWLAGRQRDAANAQMQADRQAQTDQMIFDRTRLMKQDAQAEEDRQFDRSVRLAELEGTGNAMQGKDAPTGYRDPRAQEAADVAYSMGLGKEADLERAGVRLTNREAMRQNMMTDRVWDNPNTKERIVQKGIELGLTGDKLDEYVRHNQRMENETRYRTDMWARNYQFRNSSTEYDNALRRLHEVASPIEMAARAALAKPSWRRTPEDAEVLRQADEMEGFKQQAGGDPIETLRLYQQAHPNPSAPPAAPGVRRTATASGAPAGAPAGTPGMDIPDLPPDPDGSFGALTPEERQALGL